MSTDDKKERSLDAWKLYTSIFNEFFGDYEGAYTLSPAVLLEFADRLKAQPANAFTEYNAALSAIGPTFDAEAVAWALHKLRAFGVGYREADAMMLDRLMLMTMAPSDGKADG